MGADHTGIKVDEGKHWFRAWQNEHLTYIAHSATRGKAAVEAHFPDGFPGATLVLDGWRVQTGTVAKHHQTCPAHLLRDLNKKYEGSDRSRDFRELLYDAIRPGQESNIEKSKVQKAKVVERLQKPLEGPPDKSIGSSIGFTGECAGKDRTRPRFFMYRKSLPTTTVPNVP